jgi:hypothetical protein
VNVRKVALAAVLLVAVIQQASLEGQSLEMTVIDSLNRVQNIPRWTLNEVDCIKETQRVLNVVRFETAAGRTAELARDF